MFVIRPITQNDLDAFEMLASSHTLGITNLPRKRELLEQKIENSISSFSKKNSKPKNETYIMVLEDTETGEIGGTSGIFSKIGVTDASHFYKIETIVPPPSPFPTPETIEILHPVAYNNGPSEICGLFLKNDFRKEGLGKLLSLSRFLFVASHLGRFDERMIAELRGVITKANTSPFWNSVGRKFLNISLREAYNLILEGKSFIPHIVPKYPVYIPLLPSSAQRVIGKPHHHTRPALKMLSQEGFTFAEEIDIIEGGPKLIARTRDIRTVRQSTSAQVKAITKKPIDSPQYMLGTTSLNFRACYAHLRLSKGHQATVSAEVAEALQIKKGDSIRYVRATPPRDRSRE